MPSCGKKFVFAFTILISVAPTTTENTALSWLYAWSKVGLSDSNVYFFVSQLEKIAEGEVLSDSEIATQFQKKVLDNYNINISTSSVVIEAFEKNEEASNHLDIKVSEFSGAQIEIIDIDFSIEKK